MCVSLNRLKLEIFEFFISRFSYNPHFCCESKFVASLRSWTRNFTQTNANWLRFFSDNLTKKLSTRGSGLEYNFVSNFDQPSKYFEQTSILFNNFSFSFNDWAKYQHSNLLIDNFDKKNSKSSFWKIFSSTYLSNSSFSVYCSSKCVGWESVMLQEEIILVWVCEGRNPAKAEVQCGHEHQKILGFSILWNNLFLLWPRFSKLVLTVCKRLAAPQKISGGQHHSRGVLHRWPPSHTEHFLSIFPS